MSTVDQAAIIRKTGKWLRGQVPDEAQRVTVHIDLGLYHCWWTVWAWRPGAIGYLVDRGMLKVHHDANVAPLAVLATLRTFRDEVLLQGWHMAGAAARLPDIVTVDAGWQKDIGTTFALESGDAYWISQGLGSSRDEDNWRNMKSGPGRVAGHEWVVLREPTRVRMIQMHTDYWKRAVHDGFTAPAGSRGSLSLYDGHERDHKEFAKHILSEREEEGGFEPGKGRRPRYWAKVGPDNHWFDCTYCCRCTADMLGVRLEDANEPTLLQVAVPVTARQPGREGWKIGR
jgi:hypothetical protein